MDDSIKKQEALTFVAEKMPAPIYSDLRAYCEKRRHDEVWDYNWKLAGALDQQSSLSEWKYECPKLEEYLLDRVNGIWDWVYTTCPWEFNKTKDITKFIKLHNLWVNYQKKNQYNPIHVHSGVVSFVIFVDIPYACITVRTCQT